MRNLLAGVAVACLYGFVSLSGAQATTLDFTAFPAGNISTIGDVTFSLAGSGETGDPYVNGQGLWNSSDGPFYPTNQILRADFDTEVSGVSFTYNPQSLNHHPDQGWSIFDSNLALIASGAFSTGSLAYDLSAYSGIARIEWNNGENNWLSNLEVLDYTPAVVPLPATLPLLLVALVGLGFAARRKAA